MQLNSQSEAIILKGIASQIMQMNVPNLLQVNNMLAYFRLEILPSNSNKELEEQIKYLKTENAILNATVNRYQSEDWNEETQSEQELDMLSAANSVNIDHIRS